MTNEFTSEAAGEGLTTAPPGSSLITTAAGHVEGFLIFLTRLYQAIQGLQLEKLNLD